ncbi:hypothetical protein CAEBREN_00915 [Caenorhabditis brenneri]|uniref:Uncharacterized protein n=1 Tax=Caenorhabditis brenneri TaxID=135651 RepID=G0NNS9_CAEBE|nr:hypothetical protein CAEBREN_00915 [Caenorhabditis brenneri]
MGMMKTVHLDRLEMESAWVKNRLTPLLLLKNREQSVMVLLKFWSTEDDEEENLAAHHETHQWKPMEPLQLPVTRTLEFLPDLLENPPVPPFSKPPNETTKKNYGGFSGAIGCSFHLQSRRLSLLSSLFVLESGASNGQNSMAFSVG